MDTLQYKNDPADFCLNQVYSNTPDNTQNNCFDIMARRCARNWDSKCDAYILQLDSSRYGNEFINKTASYKYCRSYDKNCITKCKGDSCTSGSESDYKNPINLYNISKDFSSLKDNELPSVKVGKCKQTCDILNLSNFGDDDRVLNECLDRGSCQEVMMDLSENIVANNISYSNQRLKEFINAYIVQNTSNIQSRMLLGKNAPQITTKLIDTPGPPITLPTLQPTPPSGFINNFKTTQGPFKNTKEGFNSAEQDTKLSTTTIVFIILFVLFILGGGYKMYKKYKYRV